MRWDVLLVLIALAVLTAAGVTHPSVEAVIRIFQ